jgi:hypothetical protein
MIRVTLASDQVRLPTWVVDLESFRRWTDDAFPETGPVSYLKGGVDGFPEYTLEVQAEKPE